jgi:hypothetical protein
VEEEEEEQEKGEKMWENGTPTSVGLGFIRRKIR